MHLYNNIALCVTQHLNKRDNNYGHTTKIQQMRRHAQCVRDGSNLIYYLELARFVREARWNYFIIKYLKTSVTACLPPLSPLSLPAIGKFEKSILNLGHILYAT